MVNKNKKNNNSRNSLVFGRWPQTRIICLDGIWSHDLFLFHLLAWALNSFLTVSFLEWLLLISGGPLAVTKKPCLGRWQADPDHVWPLEQVWNGFTFSPELPGHLLFPLLKMSLLITGCSTDFYLNTDHERSTKLLGSSSTQGCPELLPEPRQILTKVYSNILMREKKKIKERERRAKQLAKKIKLFEPCCSDAQMSKERERQRKPVVWYLNVRTTEIVLYT